MSSEEKENGGSIEKLRSEIKQYEKDFHLLNGRKPAREDIKKDAIAAKYKAYQSATKPPPPPSSTPQKRTRPTVRDALQEKPSRGLAATPKRKATSRRAALQQQQPILSPVQEAEPTPAHIRLQLGPTPHRDGQVLGIFDMIAATPSKTDSVEKSVPSDLLVAGTPSKPTAVNAGQSRTPQSSSKRFFLDAFAGTPLKRKRDDDIGTSSTSKRKFATPSFLRRSFPLASIEEDSADVATAMPPPFRKRGLVRSLSSIIQGLRKQEEDRMDDDWDVMNEIEQEQEGRGTGASKEPAKVLVQDSQEGEMPLGPDLAPESSEDEEAPGRGGDRPRKPWKKKGLKRQTRRVIMRPVKHKAGKEGDLAEDDGSEAEVVPETQQLDAESDEYEEAGEDDAKAGGKKQKKDTTAQHKTSPAKPKTGRKIDPNALAHANFRKLKIKNKNSKANGRGKKFGGRR